MQTLRRAENWPAVLKLLDQPESEPVRTIALRAVAERADTAVVDGLIDRLRVEADPGRRREYADLLTRVYKKPGPWVYWSYRPPPRPPNTVAWERTDAIEQALDRVLADPDRAVRLAVLRRMQREKIPTQLVTLTRWLQEEIEADRVAAILDALRMHPAGAIRASLEAVVTGQQHGLANRQAALTLLAGGLDETSEDRLLVLADAVEDGPVLAELFQHVGKRPRLTAAPLLLGKLDSKDPGVRAAAIEALADLRVTQGNEPVWKHLQDQDARVRAAAASAAGRLGKRTTIGSLLQLAQDADPGVRRASLDSLRRLREPRVVSLAVAALATPETQVAALQCISDLGGPDQAKVVVGLARQHPSAEVLPLAIGMLSKWSSQAEGAKRTALEHTLAELQGANGLLMRWHTTGPVAASAASPLIAQFASTPKQAGELDGTTAKWRSVIGTGTEGRIRVGLAKDAEAAAVWLAHTDVLLPQEAAVQFLAASSSPLRISLNGRLVYERTEARSLQPDSDRFEATLNQGVNRLLIQIAPSKGNVEFHLRFRRKSAAADHERLVQAALTRTGDAARGRKLFFDTARAQCSKCHRLGDQGERIGPDLTGIGNRFARIHLIESILEPSRTIAPSYETVLVLLKDGRIVAGTRIAETAETLTLGDNQGQKHALARASIEQVRAQAASTMPEGLEKQLTADDFVDLIAFLVNEK
jgi:putative heme-binding domain-containing protein